MNVVITGHRKSKLLTYDVEWIKECIYESLRNLKGEYGYVRGYSGMASGVDLWFCEACVVADIPYVACIPFKGQDGYMDDMDKAIRKNLIKDAVEVREVKNSWMVEQVEFAIVVWDGNKGGTHNVLQQLVEKQVSFVWINPVAKVVWDCTLGK